VPNLAMTDLVHAPATLEIDLAAIVANWRVLGARHPSGPVAGVVKADAYGLGADRVAPALHAAGCRHFFVAVLDEALGLRPRLPGALLVVLGGVPPGAEALAAAGAARCRRCCTSTPACPGSAWTRVSWRCCGAIRAGWTASTSAM
jgi:alanine racemase